jgi:hypothetical protein
MTLPMSTPSNDELCGLCREGKLFAVEEWFKRGGQPDLSPKNWRRWAMGIAIEKGFHSLVEILLKNGFPADGPTLWEAVRQRRHAIVELLLESGAQIKSVLFSSVVSVGDGDTIRLFLAPALVIVLGDGPMKSRERYPRLFRECRCGCGLRGPRAATRESIFRLRQRGMMRS